MPRVFVGSSVNHLGLAYAVQDNLEHDCEIVVWTQGVFGINEYPLQSLLEELDKCDFGIFVFHPEDLTIMKKTENLTVRDNVLFEFGLFIGRLGINRTFFISPRGVSFHLPSDLAGLSPLTYVYKDEDRGDHETMVQALGPACNKIRGQIKKLQDRHSQLEELNRKIRSLETTRSAALVMHGTIEHSQFFDVDYDALTNALQGAFHRKSNILKRNLDIISNSIFELVYEADKTYISEIGKTGGLKRLKLDLDTSDAYVVHYYREAQEQSKKGQIKNDIRLTKLLFLKEHKSLNQFEYQLITIINVRLGLISTIQFRVSEKIHDDLIDPFVEEFADHNDGLFQIVLEILERRTSDEHASVGQQP